MNSKNSRVERFEDVLSVECERPREWPTHAICEGVRRVLREGTVSGQKWRRVAESAATATWIRNTLLRVERRRAPASRRQHRRASRARWSECGRCGGASSKPRAPCSDTASTGWEWCCSENAALRVTRHPLGKPSVPLAHVIRGIGLRRLLVAQLAALCSRSPCSSQSSDASGTKR